MRCVSALVGRVGILWRGDAAARSNPVYPERLQPVVEALTGVGVVAAPLVYSDAVADEARARLLELDGVLVWVDPIAGGEDRSTLDVVLRDVSDRSVWVSAHPETIRRMGTKEVLYRTCDLGWGTETFLYSTYEEFVRLFPTRLMAGAPRVLKPNRGNGGIGVWKVERLPADPRRADGVTPVDVRVQHAAPRDATTEVVTLESFMGRLRSAFEGSGRLIDQTFAERLSEGMIRAYLVRDEIVGFAHQQPRSPADDPTAPPPHEVLGLPSAKTMFGPDEPRFARLRRLLEQEWVQEMQHAVGVTNDALPLLWDADFLYGPAHDGVDTYVLCEINVSSVTPFPKEAVPKLARAARDRCRVAP